MPPLNALVFPGEDPTSVPDVCATALQPHLFVHPVDPAETHANTGILPGQSFSYTGLEKGVHRFQCMIHPWMKSTVTVR